MDKHRPATWIHVETHGDVGQETSEPRGMGAAGDTDESLRGDFALTGSGLLITGAEGAVGEREQGGRGRAEVSAGQGG